MDQIDILSGLKQDGELYRIRRERPDYVDGAEICRDAVLSPNHGFDLGPALRAALAARMARLIGRDDLARRYDLMLEEAGIDDMLAAIASAAAVPDEGGFITAIVRHADLVTKAPRNSTKADIERLEAASLSNPQIIALSELIAFVNFEARSIVGLEILEQVA